MRTTVLSVTILAIAVSAGCGSDEKAKPLKIAFGVSALANGFHQAQARWAREYASSKYGATIEIFDGGSSNEQMLANMDAIIAGDYDMATLQIWPVDDAAPKWQAMIDKGMQVASFFDAQRIPIPSLNADEPGTSEQMGRVAAQQWKAAHPDTPITFVALGWPSNAAVKSGRTDAFAAGVWSVDPSARDLGCLDASGGADAAKALTQDLLYSHPEVNIIYSEAADLTVGVMPALTEAGRGTMTGGIPQTEIVASVDCPENELYEIYDPTISLKMSMALPPREIAQARIDNLMDIKDGRIPQVDASNATTLYPTPAMMVSYWESMTMAQAVSWFNDEFQANAQVRTY